MIPGRSSRTRLYLVAYDVADDGRRRKVHDTLLDFGTPIQYSVFECRLTPRDLTRMLERVRSLTVRYGDALMVRGLCAECERRDALSGARHGGPRPVVV